MAKNKDIEPRRATYGVQYPNFFMVLHARKENGHDIVFPLRKKGDHYSVTGRNIVLWTPRKSWGDIEFNQCRFNYKKGNELLLISDLTFRNCSFTECFLGGCIFQNVRFHNCKFIKSDFFNSRFDSCSFKDAVFENCSAIYAKFERTELSANSFFSQFQFPVDLYSKEEYKGDLEKNEKQFYENRLEVAQQIYRGNSDLAIHQLTDEALYKLKEFEYEAAKKDFRGIKRDLHWKKKIEKRINLTFLLINLEATCGGTSLKRLTIYGVRLWVALTLLLWFSDIRVGDCSESVGFDFLQSLSIFLGFGFTNFTPNNLFDLVILVAFATLGITWYSLLVPILIRKIYR